MKSNRLSQCKRRPTPESQINARRIAGVNLSMLARSEHEREQKRGLRYLEYEVGVITWFVKRLKFSKRVDKCR